MVLAQMTCIKKPKGGCPGSVPKGTARRQDGKMSQEVGVSALGIAAADSASGHVLVPCNPAPLALCVSMNCQLPLNMGNATTLTPGNPILALSQALPYAKCNTLSGTFFISFTLYTGDVQAYPEKVLLGGWGVVRVFLICESCEMRRLVVEMLLEVPPTYIAGQPR